MSRIALQPEGWPRPKGYSNGIICDSGKNIFLAGIIGWNDREEFESDDFVDQLREILVSIKTLLAEAGAAPEHIVRMTWYITDKKEYLARLSDIAVVWRETLGKVYPAMACVEVSALMEDRAKVEIETTAVLPT